MLVQLEEGSKKLYERSSQPGGDKSHDSDAEKFVENNESKNGGDDDAGGVDGDLDASKGDLRLHGGGVDESFNRLQQRIALYLKKDSNGDYGVCR